MTENARLNISLVEIDGSTISYEESFTLDDYLVIINLFKFYIKLGFDHYPFFFETEDFKVQYDPKSNLEYGLLLLVDKRDNTAHSYLVEKWAGKVKVS